MIAIAHALRLVVGRSRCRARYGRVGIRCADHKGHPLPHTGWDGWATQVRWR